MKLCSTVSVLCALTMIGSGISCLNCHVSISGTDSIKVEDCNISVNSMYQKFYANKTVKQNPRCYTISAFNMRGKIRARFDQGCLEEGECTEFDSIMGRVAANLPNIDLFLCEECDGDECNKSEVLVIMDIPTGIRDDETTKFKITSGSIRFKKNFFCMLSFSMALFVFLRLM